MALPKFDIPRGVVEVGGQSISVRGLTRAEMLKVVAATQAEDADADAVGLAYGCDVDLAEATEWLNNSPLEVGAAVLAKVMELSGTGLGKAPSTDSTPEN